MNMLSEALISIFEKGGPILTVIFVQFLLLWYFASEKFLYFKAQFGKDFEKFKKNISHISASNEFLYEAKLIREASLLKQKVNKNFWVIKVLVMICPLLGLLGTVTGMISVFDVLSIAGSGNARAMASGISKATIPTMAGMIGALGGLFIIKFLKDYAAKSLNQITSHLYQVSLSRKQKVKG